MIAKLREDFPDLPERPDAKTVFVKLQGAAQHAGRRPASPPRRADLRRARRSGRRRTRPGSCRCARRRRPARPSSAPCSARDWSCWARATLPPTFAAYDTCRRTGSAVLAAAYADSQPKTVPLMQSIDESLARYGVEEAAGRRLVEERVQDEAAAVRMAEQDAPLRIAGEGRLDEGNELGPDELQERGLAAAARRADVRRHVVARAQRFVADGDDHHLRVHRLDDVDERLETRFAVEQVDRRQVRPDRDGARRQVDEERVASCRCSATRSISSAPTRPSSAARAARPPPPPQPAVTRPSNATREERRVTVTIVRGFVGCRRRRVYECAIGQDRGRRPSTVEDS